MTATKDLEIVLSRERLISRLCAGKTSAEEVAVDLGLLR